MLPTRTTVLILLFGLLVHLAGLAYAALHALLARTFPTLDAWLPGAATLGPLHGVVLGFSGAVFFVFLLDGLLAWRSTSPARLRVRRERPQRLAIGVTEEVAVVVENLGRRRLRLWLRDTPPPGFPVEPDLLTAAVRRRGLARLLYRLTPRERGNFTFGDLHVRCRGPLGLAWADRAVAAAEPVAVYPNLLEIRRYEALVRATLVRSGGARRQRLPGGGREFSHYRDYTPDDDFRHVSWTATARRGKPIAAVHESELSQDIIFALDIGRTMAAKVGGLSKLDCAINAVLMLTHVSQSFQDNLGLLIFSHAVHLYLPPAKGKAQHAQFLKALYNVQPELSYVNYREAFGHLVGRHPKRALTMVFTDLLDSVVSAEYRDAARLLRRFHLPLTLAVADVPLQHLAARTPATKTEMYDILAARDLLQGRAELLAGLEREGVLVLDTVPERLTTDAVNRYLAIKTGVLT